MLGSIEALQHLRLDPGVSRRGLRTPNAAGAQMPATEMRAASPDSPGIGPFKGGTGPASLNAASWHPGQWGYPARASAAEYPQLHFGAWNGPPSARSIGTWLEQGGHRRRSRSCVARVE